MTNHTKKWIRAGIETLIHGGTAALISSITASVVDKEHFPLFSTPFWRMFQAGFVGNGLLRFLQWWNNNPLPPDETHPPILGPTPTISLNPLSKITTLTKQ